jgi:hypothetical protein
MQHTTKSVLVPPELFWRLDKRNLSDLDKSMHDILFDTQMSDEDKWKLYSQSLQKYLHQSGEHLKPLQIPMLESELRAKDVEHVEHVEHVEDDEIPVQPQGFNVPREALLVDLDVERIIAASRLSKNVKNKACNLIKILSEGKRVVWNNLGEVTINGSPLPRSNIVTLVTNAVKSKNDSKPQGWDKFALAVIAANVPKLYLGANVERQYIEAMNTPHPSDIPLMMHSPPEQPMALRSKIRTPAKPYSLWQNYKL